MPSGSYEVVTEEEQLLGISFLAYRRLQTYICRQSIPNQKGLQRSYDVNPQDLSAKFARDGRELDISIHK